MPERRTLAPAVVVGVDGSRPAIEAALWAVDEAVSRDIPLRLVYAIEGRGTEAQEMARQFAAAEIAVRCAAAAVESTDKPVKIEVEILREGPLQALRDASTNAVMLCVGSIGLKHFQDGRIGSTAATLASVARCPVAIVRGHDPMKSPQRCVVVEVGEMPTGDAVLRRGLEEAQLRDAPLRVVTTWRSRYTDIHDNDAVTAGNRCAKAALERRLAQWRRRYPNLDVTAVAVHGNPLTYLIKHGDSIQLLVVAHDRGEGIRELLGAPGNAALHHANCSVLICEPQNVL
jgi:nucleotide-binding universal stress UspA family protein